MDKEQSTQLTDGSTPFNRRYFEVMRRAGILATDVGRTALRGAYEIKDSHYEELRNYEIRQYHELTSGLAEALQGIVKTHYTFDLKDGKLVAKDGELIEDLLDHGHANAKALADNDRFFDFYEQRSVKEIGEFYEQQAMASGSFAYNTIVTFSPYTQELDTSEENRKKLKKAAQKPQFKRAMLRVSHWDGEQLHIFTRSIDNSDKELIKELAYQTLGKYFYSNDSTSMLGEREHIKIDNESWQDLPDLIAAKADEILSKRYRGQKFIQGRSESDAHDLQAYVESQDDIVQHLMNVGRELALYHGDYTSYEQAFNDEIYKYVALLERRLEQGTIEPIKGIGMAANAAGLIAQASGKIYDMCGLVLNPNGTPADVATQTGFESLLRLMGKQIKCPACHEKVVAPTVKLTEGILACPRCKYEVDGCTGHVYHKSERPGPKEQPKQPDFFDRLSRDLEGYAKQQKISNTIKRQKEAAQRERSATSSWLW